MPVFGTDSPALTVDVLLKQPTLIARELTSLVSKRLIADKLFIRGSADQVAGGAMRYQELESIYLTDTAGEVAEGSDFPMTSWSEAVKTAAVKGYGQGFPVTNLAIRRNQRDLVIRGTRKLANNIVKAIDTVAIAALVDTTTYTSIQTASASAHWNIAGTDIIADVTAAQEKLELKDNGYNGFEGATLILHTNHRDDLLNNTVLRAALPREATDQQIRTGMMLPFAGLGQILFSPQVDTTKAILMDTSIAGVIADEPPDPGEGWVTDTPEGQNAPVYVKVEPFGKPAVHRSVYGGRWPAIAITQPDAICVITGIA